ncbi:NAD(P)-binding protein [Ascodesmis nigricans]|uniref:NAD(P)-binding protein n=1 Tax=Ascodesmis nigricans TaxID=341454 RepID=A0A4S2MWF2_9PEZI|nr:NAD(P)-binding protein [Ascodesmis nigricans]
MLLSKASYFHSPLGFIHRQFRHQIPPFHTPISPPLSSRTILLTGFTSGIGFQAAVLLLKEGANLVLVARNPARAEYGLKKIRDKLVAEGDWEAVLGLGEEKVGSGKTKRVRTLCCDQLDLEDVVRFAREVEGLLRSGEIAGLDAAVLNAGIVPGEWRVTKDGWEESLQVNVLSTALLALILLPLLRTYSTVPTPSRLIFLNSDSSSWWSLRELSASNTLSAFNIENTKQLDRRYPRTKTLLLLFTFALLRRESNHETPTTSSLSLLSTPTAITPISSHLDPHLQVPHIDLDFLGDIPLPTPPSPSTTAVNSSAISTHDHDDDDHDLIHPKRKSSPTLPHVPPPPPTSYSTASTHLAPPRKHVAIITLTPGLCNTEIFDSIPESVKGPIEKIAWDAKEGGRVVAIAAADGVVEVDEWDGKFVAAGIVAKRPGKLCYGKKGVRNQEKVYHEVMDVLYKRFPEVVEPYKPRD